MSVVAAGAVASPSTGAGTATTGASAAQPSLDEKLRALVATVQKPPHPVVGTDKRLHLVYEIGLINTAPLTQVIDSVQVIDPARHKVLVAFDDPADISGIMTTSTTSGEGVNELGPNEAGMLFINVELPPGARVPDRLVHQIDSSLPDAGVNLSLNGAATGVAHRGPIVISPPLAGRGYINENGCCGRSDHPRSVLTIDGQSWLAQRFAIDWVRADSEGRIYVGDWQVNDNWIIFGDPVLSATSGTVIETLNTMPENTPPTPAPNPTPYTALGNHVIVDIGNGAYALYAHHGAGQRDGRGRRSGPCRRAASEGSGTREAGYAPPALPHHRRPVGGRRERHPLRLRHVPARQPGLERRRPQRRHAGPNGSARTRPSASVAAWASSRSGACW